MSRALYEADLPSTLSHESDRHFSTLHGMSETDLKKMIISEFYAQSLQAVFIAMTALSCSSLAISFVMKKHTIYIIDTE
jgi:hypothetical protein